MIKSFKIFAIITLLSFSLVFFLLLPSHNSSANANEFFVASSDEIIFYNDDNVALFVVPETYYMLKTGEQLTGDYYYVSYKGIDGRVTKDSVSAASLMTLSEPYYSESLTVDSTRDFILVHRTPSTNAEEKLFFETMNFEFIGIMNDTVEDSEVVFYYVRYNNTQYGYIISDHSSNPGLAESITPHPNSIEQPEPSPSPSPSPNPNQPTEPTNDMLRVLLILGISVPAVIVVFLLFRPSGKSNNRARPRGRDYYDDYDDYDDDYYYDDYRDRGRSDYRRRR